MDIEDLPDTNEVQETVDNTESTFAEESTQFAIPEPEPEPTGFSAFQDLSEPEDALA